MEKSIQFHIRFVKYFELSRVNKSNDHSWSPVYFMNQKYIVDQNWFSKLSKQIQEDFSKKFQKHELTNIEYPHQYDRCSQYWDFYTWYNCQLYDFGKYCNQIEKINKQNISLIKFEKGERQIFQTLFHKQNPQIQKLERLNGQIKKILEKENKNGYFIKLTQRSGKNQIKLFPAFTLKDVYNNLIYSLDVKKQIYESSGIVMREWKNFDKQCIQFRAFIFQKKLIAISQQFFQNQIKWKNVNFTAFLNSLQQKIQKINYIDSFVLDVMYLNENENIFLELNPYGVYSASRSALLSHQQIIKLEKSIGNDIKILVKLVKF